MFKQNLENFLSKNHKDKKLKIKSYSLKKLGISTLVVVSLGEFSFLDLSKISNKICSHSLVDKNHEKGLGSGNESNLDEEVEIKTGKDIKKYFYIIKKTDNSFILNGVNPEFKKIKKITFLKNLDINISEINSFCFEGCTNLETVVLPDSVTDIGNFCFSKCTSLVSILLPENLKNIGVYCFFNCLKLANISLPDTLMSIGKNCFIYCNTTIDVPNNDILLKVSDSTNSYNHYNIEINFTSSKERVDDKIRQNLETKNIIICNLQSNLTKLNDENNAVNNKNLAEQHTDKQESFTILKEITEENLEKEYKIKKQEYIDFYFKGCDENNIYFYKDKSNGLLLVRAADFDCDVRVIDFSHASKTTKLKIPKFYQIGQKKYTVTGIYQSFYKKNNIKEITLPNSVVNIWPRCFDSCKNLKRVKFGTGVKKIPFACFINCRNLEKVELTNKTKALDKSSFNGCLKLKLKIPKSVKTIGENCFVGCSPKNINFEHLLKRRKNAKLIESTWNKNDQTINKEIDRLIKFYKKIKNYFEKKFNFLKEKINNKNNSINNKKVKYAKKLCEIKLKDIKNLIDRLIKSKSQSNKKIADEISKKEKEIKYIKHDFNEKTFIENHIISKLKMLEYAIECSNQAKEKDDLLKENIDKKFKEEYSLNFNKKSNFDPFFAHPSCLQIIAEDNDSSNSEYLSIWKLFKNGIVPSIKFDEPYESILDLAFELTKQTNIEIFNNKNPNFLFNKSGKYIRKHIKNLSNRQLAVLVKSLEILKKETFKEQPNQLILKFLENKDKKEIQHNIEKIQKLFNYTKISNITKTLNKNQKNVLKKFEELDKRNPGKIQREEETAFSLDYKEDFYTPINKLLSGRAINRNKKIEDVLSKIKDLKGFFKKNNKYLKYDESGRVITTENAEESEEVILYRTFDLPELLDLFSLARNNSPIWDSSLRKQIGKALNKPDNLFLKSNPKSFLIEKYNSWPNSEKIDREKYPNDTILNQNPKFLSNVINVLEENGIKDKILTYKNFLSTSYSDKHWGEGVCRLVFRIPKLTKAISYDIVSHNGRDPEKEILFAPGFSFQINSLEVEARPSNTATTQNLKKYRITMSATFVPNNKSNNFEQSIQKIKNIKIDEMEEIFEQDQNTKALVNEFKNNYEKIISLINDGKKSQLNCEETKEILNEYEILKTEAYEIKSMRKDMEKLNIYVSEIQALFEQKMNLIKNLGFELYYENFINNCKEIEKIYKEEKSLIEKYKNFTQLHSKAIFNSNKLILAIKVTEKIEEMQKKIDKAKKHIDKREYIELKSKYEEAKNKVQNLDKISFMEFSKFKTNIKNINSLLLSLLKN